MLPHSDSEWKVSWENLKYICIQNKMCMYIYVRTHAQLCVCAKRALSPQTKVNISSSALLVWRGAKSWIPNCTTWTHFFSQNLCSKANANNRHRKKGLSDSLGECQEILWNPVQKTCISNNMSTLPHFQSSLIRKFPAYIKDSL